MEAVVATDYYSNRARGHTPRINETIPLNVWGGLISLVNRFLANGGFGIDFPTECPDGRGPIGTDSRAFKLSLEAEVPQISFPVQNDELPDTLAILDFVEFCHSHVAWPEEGSHHGFFDHYHLSFDRSRGRAEFRESVERIFARNGIIY